MPNPWIPQPSNAGSSPCRNDANCYFLKNGHCWYFHPPHHYTHNQRVNERQQTTTSNSNSNPSSGENNQRVNERQPTTTSNSSSNPSLGENNQRVNERQPTTTSNSSSNPSSGENSNPFSQPYNNSNSISNDVPNIFNTTHPPTRNQGNSNQTISSNRNARRRRNQRQNRAARNNSNNSHSSHPPRSAPSIQSPVTKRTRIDTPEIESLHMSSLTIQSSNDKEITIEAFQCPISMEAMADPVVAADGHSYDRICIEQWFRHNNRSPMNNTILQHKKLLPNYTLKKCILEWNTLKTVLSPEI